MSKMIMNHSKVMMESAKMMECPRCKGHGSCIYDDDPCVMCNGWGKLWMTESSWYQAKYSKESSLY